MSPRAPADVGELPDLDGASAEYILTWAIERFFPEIAVACSMQDAVLVDLAWRIEPRIEVFFLETGFHFPETLETAQKMRDRYKAHDETDQYKTGDRVEIQEFRPISRDKRWMVTRLIARPAAE